MHGTDLSQPECMEARELEAPPPASMIKWSAVSVLIDHRGGQRKPQTCRRSVQLQFEGGPVFELTRVMSVEAREREFRPWAYQRSVWRNG